MNSVYSGPYCGIFQIVTHWKWIWEYKNVNFQPVAISKKSPIV